MRAITFWVHDLQLLVKTLNTEIGGGSFYASKRTQAAYHNIKNK